MALMDLQLLEDLSDRETITVVKDLYAAFLRGDIKAVLNLLAEDVDWLTAGPPEILFAGQRVGQQQVAEYFKISAETVIVAEQRPQIEEIIADGEKVVVIGKERGRLKANGRAYEAFWVHVFTLREGRSIKVRQYIDTAAFLSAYRADSQESWSGLPG